MDEPHQQMAIEALRDWSKWVIGFNMIAASGCIVVLLGGAAGLPRLYLISAIVLFALSALSSVFLVKALVNVVQRLPVKNTSGDYVSIYRYRVLPGLPLGALSWLQLLLLVLGVAALLGWVLVRPVSP